LYWIGGSPCAGKSSIAASLAARHGLIHFECDAGTDARMARMATSPPPAFARLTALSTGQRLARPPSWQAGLEVAFYREQFPFLRAEFPAGAKVVAEGADLLPELLEVPLEHAVWIVPTPEFQLRHYRERAWVEAYLAECPDPAAAFDSWMDRDMRFARYVRRSAERIGGMVIVVDGSHSVNETAALVEEHFGLRGETVGP
jgi:hypothetical protein